MIKLSIGCYGWCQYLDVNETISSKNHSFLASFKIHESIIKLHGLRTYVLLESFAFRINIEIFLISLCTTCFLIYVRQH